ncbi:MAG: 16S rRNA (uracil(1498)-N(3))-methyltransferase [Lachnospiraceae bacterium]|nr:16S rRNA (uracil(1498)-N(3))-methyltransferase [Lachnospiraceae bacterium]
MQHFFAKPENITKEQIRIDGADVNHMKNVLRMKIGEEVSVSDGISDTEYRCEVEAFLEDEVLLKIRFVKEDGVELPAKIILFQGLPKADKMELIVQKAVELGAAEIVPVAMDRCVMKIDAKKEKNKIERWQGIAEAAAKQSKRGVLPNVTKVMSMKEACKYAQELDVVAIPYELAEGMEATKGWLQKCSDAESIGIFIGPEGGFAEKEVALVEEIGGSAISLGRRILRTETAGLTTLSILMYHLEIGQENN